MVRTKGIIVMLLIGVLLLIPAVTATEYNENDSYRLEDGEYTHTFLKGIQEGDTIDVTVEVTAGGNIDVMIMDSFNFAI